MDGTVSLALKFKVLTCPLPVIDKSTPFKIPNYRVTVSRTYHESSSGWDTLVSAKQTVTRYTGSE